MSQIGHLIACPVCNANDIRLWNNVRDHSVTNEQFPVFECGRCSVRFTQNPPCVTAMARYYQAQHYVSHNETREGLINYLFHRVRSITLLQKRKWVQRYTRKQAGMHLDYGAGTGAFVHHMELAGWNSIGMEPDTGARERALQLYNVPVFDANEDAIILPGTYNAITLWHVLEHVHSLHETLERLKNALAPGGCLFIAVPNYTAADAQHYGVNWAAYDVPRHLYHFSPASMQQLLQQHELQIIALQPMWFDSFYVSMLSEKYRGGSMLKAIWQGLRSNLRALANPALCSSVVYIATRKSG